MKSRNGTRKSFQIFIFVLIKLLGISWQQGLTLLRYIRVSIKLYITICQLRSADNVTAPWTTQRLFANLCQTKSLSLDQ